MPENGLTYKRVLIKLSGESLAGDEKTGINPSVMDHFVREIENVHALGAQIGIVIGGGNIFRGVSGEARKMDRVAADQMGMLATIINSIALKDRLARQNIPACIMSATQMSAFTEYFTVDSARRHLSNNEVLIMSGGTGNPYFTTDTAAVLRAVEIGADVILKGTRVDGVYNADPEKVEDAIKFDELKYVEVLKRELKVMDLTAITLAMDNKLPIIVFNFDKANNLKRVLLGENIGTKVQG
ncbi:MAG: UMP kinase [Caldithrix sp.]|nr:UMP kinase [Caldithrix sp.]